MTDSKVNNNNKWQNLDWEKKVEICQQAIAHEDNLLSTYRTIFIALEVMFFAVVLSLTLDLWLNIIIAALAIYVAVRFVKIWKDTGDHVDLWGKMLYSLWQEVADREEYASGVLVSELAKRYEGCYQRSGKDWKATVLGRGSRGDIVKHLFWGYGRRRFIITFTPMVVILAWILVVVIKALAS